MSARSLEAIAVALHELQRKLQELEAIDASLALDPPIVRSSVKVMPPIPDVHTEDDTDPDLEQALETVRVWCTHVSHVLDRYLHPSLARIFMDDANGRLIRRSRQDFRATMRWIFQATRLILMDTVEHGNRLYRQGETGVAERILLSAGSRGSMALNAHAGDATRIYAQPIGNWAVMGPPDVNASLFIIHGHDDAARDDLERLLRRYLVRTVLMYAQTLPTVTLPEKFERCAKDCNLAIALLTPDDIGGKLGADSTAARVRQNVLIELGWFWGRCGLHNVLLLSSGALDLPSDLTGLQVVHYGQTVENAMSSIDAFMRFHKIAVREGLALPAKKGSRKRSNPVVGG